MISLIGVGVEQVEVSHMKIMLLLQKIDVGLGLPVQRLQARNVVPSTTLGILLQTVEIFVERSCWERQL